MNGRREKDTKKIVRKVASEPGQDIFIKGREIAWKQQLWMVPSTVMHLRINENS